MDTRKPLGERRLRVLSIYVGALMAAIAVVLFLLVLPPGSTGGSPELARAQTVAVTSVAFFQIFYLLMCRTLTAPLRSIGWTSNLYVFGGIGLLLVLQVSVVHLPFMQALFRTADLTATDWLAAAAAGARGTGRERRESVAASPRCAASGGRVERERGGSMLMSRKRFLPGP
jgi:magnesium-transporting ATPase (P-type)